MIGEKCNYSSLVALLDNTHTYANILRETEWCVCFPTFQHDKQCFETIRLNLPDNDEITDSGFTLEAAKAVQAPRIAECPINPECRLEWHRPLYENSHWHLFAGRVLHLAMDEPAMVPDPAERMRTLGLMYNIRSTVHPLTGEQYGPNTLGLRSEIEKIYSNQACRKVHGRHPLWRVVGFHLENG